MPSVFVPPRTPTLTARSLALALVLVFALCVGLGIAVADVSPPDEVAVELERTARTYMEQTAYRLHFIQENYWSLADSTFATGATLTVSPPRQLSLRYDDGGRVVAAAGTLRVYIPQTKQFFVSQIDSADLTIDPASILMMYDLHPTEPVIGSDESALSVRLVPSNRYMDPVRVDVTIDRARHTVTRLTAHSSSGDRSTYVIQRTELGVSVPEGEFRLDPPPGASIQGGSPYDYGDVGS